ncbi:nucleotidyl transferase AbiEii/AbiGii toxin family protein [Agrobacterium rubi]|nr:nucleotidyl transferase AbiEii/AbiGii toxin family protein [Agrobacterium rubi]NTF24569.1 nucleotidyl transferase AbiEii/AbiGii toxin family protein [Agrobacterium rubi]
MGLTLQAIDSVTAEHEQPPCWTFGGGTSLAIDLEHRISYDIDAFMDSARIVKQLVPVNNPITRDICWDPARQKANYQYPGHYLKLIRTGVGEIDFLTASSLVESSTTEFEFKGRIIDRERPCEVIAKKIYYRGATFKSRDVFDLAGTFIVLPHELSEAAGSIFMTPEIYDRARLRIETMKDAFNEDMPSEVNPTDFGRSYIENACELALEALDFMQYPPQPTCSA